MRLGKHGIQESGRVDRALAIVERDDYADIQSLRSKDMTVRAVFHLGIVTHWSKVICLPNDTYPTAHTHFQQVRVGHVSTAWSWRVLRQQGTTVHRGGEGGNASDLVPSAPFSGP